ncbi:hypothetical protein LshimejAT787_0700140 [Lyophyllum shimeji]|uniref:Uncharacterized protein n=1 Tax=Lyophyllum shimeji TaxID=47721 RepID=A0A9P3ULP0_LYOSH|nr:hypothetical protein LshimejAT787_0700140 [Lyophyllum shimeji]
MQLSAAVRSGQRTRGNELPRKTLASALRRTDYVTLILRASPLQRTEPQASLSIPLSMPSFSITASLWSANFPPIA